MKLMLFFLGTVIGCLSSQFGYRYFFLEINLVDLLLGKMIAQLTQLGIEADVIFIGVISLPYYSLLGIILGLLLARFPKETHKYFIYGFLINFILYFTLPFIKWDVVIILIESAAGEKQLRYYELLFSNFYSVVSIYLAILLNEKLRKVKNITY